MQKKHMYEISAPPPERKELSDNPVKLCNEIARIFRARMRGKCDIDGVMSQPGARLVLSVLAISDGVNQRELVEKTHLRAPTVSLIIKRMAEEGMVELKADESDLRKSRVYLTKHGRDTDRVNIEMIRRTDEIGLRGITSVEQEQLMRLLGRIRANLLDGEDNK